jgi:hypothetical protein
MAKAPTVVEETVVEETVAEVTPEVTEEVVEEAVELSASTLAEMEAGRATLEKAAASAAAE